MTQALGGQLPNGIEILSVTLTESNASVQPRSVEYVFPVRVDEEAELRSRLEEGIARVMESERCAIERTAPGRKAARRIDVRPFLRSIHLENTHLVVECLTGTTGSVRIDEIMQLFGLRTQDLAGPVRRTRVTWETTQIQNGQQPRREDGAEDIQDAT